ncbi:hypothetical protein B0A48_11227 [Cryoendolithus antarcticus]|uniref:UDP-N-acetylglucosamine transferase subunit ALG14 n=1 Tax=Cryoendolithus antarcticus TaxID=1507870 RepID=A0A1V8SV63_9PEZI|nr:hypothetical protein B0A48_11227 [Cryoendolithus antarcticus]
MFLLLQLPAELRNRVYGFFILRLDHPVKMRVRHQPALSLINRQIRQETLSMFYSINTIDVDPWDDNEEAAIRMLKPYARHLSSISALHYFNRGDAILATRGGAPDRRREWTFKYYYQKDGRWRDETAAHTLELWLRRLGMNVDREFKAFMGPRIKNTEMIAMLERAVNSPSPQQLDWRDFAHRTWVVGEDDELSATRAKKFEELATSLTSQETAMRGKVRAYTDHGPGSYEIKKVPRARAIYQSPLTSPFSVLRCFIACWSILTTGVYPEDVSAMQHIPADTKGRDYPDIILVNGPATGTVMVLASVALRFFDYKGAATRFRMRTLYVESWARVKRLSLSGRILAHMVDRCLVQWPLLDAKKTGPGRAEFQGCFV